MLAATLVASIALSPVEKSYAGATYPIPAGIPGDCSADVTQPILSWIASVPDYSVLSFGTGACYQIEGTLELTNRSGLVLEGNGATFTAATTGNAWRSQWRLVGGSQVIFRNMTVHGGSTVGGTFVAELQWQHAFDLRGVAAVEIDNVHASDLYGDCVYVGLGLDSSKSWSSGVRVHDSTCTRNGRQGMAVVAGRDVLFENNSLSQIALNAFNVEPNGAGFGAQNVTVRGNQVSGALNKSFFVANGDGPVDSMTVSNNTLSGAGMYMAVLAPAGQRRSNITIAGNSGDTGYSSPGSAALDFVRVDGITVTGNAIPLSGANMALAAAYESCDVNVSGNTFTGGVMEVRIAPYSCPTSSPPPPPTATITSPAAGATVSGRTTITAQGANSTRMELYVDGVLKASSTTSTISFGWNTKSKSIAPGAHTITARAYNAGNTMGSSSIVVYK